MLSSLQIKRLEMFSKLKFSQSTPILRRLYNVFHYCSKKISSVWKKKKNEVLRKHQIPHRFHMVVSGEFGSQGVSKICSSMGGWSVLPYDLLVEIAKRLIFEDFVAFSAVGSWWRSSAKKMAFFKPYNPPLQMYFEDQPPTKIVKYYSFSTCKTYKIPLTKFNPHRVFLSLPWLIIVEQDFHSIFLFNPLNGVQIELPSISNPRILSEPGRFLASIDKFVLSACPSKTSDYILASIHRYPFGLSFWRPGQTPWNNAKFMMETDNDIASVIFHKGHFYGLDKGGKFFKVLLDMNDMWIKLRVLSVNKEKCKLTHIEDLYLVESAGALLTVSRRASWKPDKICEFRVYEVNIVDGKWTRMMSLGDRAIFVGGKSNCFSVHALDYPECKPNCIYFINGTTSSGAIRDEDDTVCLYNLQDRRTEIVDYWICSSYWVQPTF